MRDGQIARRAPPLAGLRRRGGGLDSALAKSLVRLLGRTEQRARTERAVRPERAAWTEVENRSAARKVAGAQRPVRTERAERASGAEVHDTRRQPLVGTARVRGRPLLWRPRDRQRQGVAGDARNWRRYRSDRCRDRSDGRRHWCHAGKSKCNAGDDGSALECKWHVILLLGAEINW
jgi:hypothetical protein